MRLLLGIAGAFILGPLSWVGCGGETEKSPGSGEVTCGKILPCGGDIVGKWTVSQVCTDPDAATNELVGQLPCTGVKVESTKVTSSGTITFNADMTYEHALESTASGTLSVPGNCLKLAGAVTATCEQLASIALLAAGEILSSLECSAKGDGCTCDAGIKVPDFNESGTYSLSGTTVIREDGGGEYSSNYCVQGNTLHLVALGMSASGASSINGDLIAKR